jgi:hypothetical protein
MTEHDHHRRMVALLLRKRHLATGDGGGRPPTTMGVLEVDPAGADAAEAAPALLPAPSVAAAADIAAGGRVLTQGYFETYTSSDGIRAEHALDARALLRTMQALPAF